MRVYTYLVILAVVSTLLPYGNIHSGAGLILSETGLINNGQNFANSNFYSKISLILLAAGIGGIVIGLFTRQSSESILVSGFAFLLFGFAADYVAIYQYINNAYSGSFVAYMLAPVFIGLIVGYGISIVEWWRGTD